MIVLLLTFFMVHMLLPTVHSAHSQRRPTRRPESYADYDRSVTTFDPNGRLLQVEYAQAAAGRGDSVIAVVQDETIYVVCKQSAAEKVHVVDEKIWMVSSGLAGDSLFLADLLREQASQYGPSFGESMRTNEAAKAAGSLQHRLTLVPGLRPLGVVALIIGTAAEEEGGSYLYRCGPGGVVQNCRYCTAGSEADSLLHALSRREWDDTTVVNTIVDAMQEVLGRRTLVDLWVFRPGADVRCYESIGDHSSKMNLMALLEKNKE